MNWTVLAALVWDASDGDEPQGDHDYIKQIIKQNNGPALDVGCGTGRLLLRFMAAGMDVDGMDTSADMPAICRQKEEKRGLPMPALYQQAMQEFAFREFIRQSLFPAAPSVCLPIERKRGNRCAVSMLIWSPVAYSYLICSGRLPMASHYRSRRTAHETTRQALEN